MIALFKIQNTIRDWRDASLKRGDTATAKEDTKALKRINKQINKIVKASMKQNAYIKSIEKRIRDLK